MVSYDAKFQEMEMICDVCGANNYFDGEEEACEVEAKELGWVEEDGKDLCPKCAVDEPEEDPNNGQ